MSLCRVSTPTLHFDDINGAPLVGGFLHVFVAGTSTPTITYRDKNKRYANTNPIKLNERGECEVWIDVSKAYKFVLYDQEDVGVIWERDYVTALGIYPLPGTNIISVSGTANEIEVTDNADGDGHTDYVVGLSGTVKTWLLQQKQRIDKNEDDITVINNEISNLENADDVLRDAITQLEADVETETARAKSAEAIETSTRIAEDTKLQQAIDGEADAREHSDESIRNTIEDLRDFLHEEREEREDGDAAATTEVTAGNNISVTKTRASDGHNIYEVSGVESVPNVNVTSDDGSITVVKTDVGNNRNFDLSVNGKKAKWAEFLNRNNYVTVTDTDYHDLADLTRESGGLTLTLPTGTYRMSCELSILFNSPVDEFVRVDLFLTSANIQLAKCLGSVTCSGDIASAGTPFPQTSCFSFIYSSGVETPNIVFRVKTQSPTSVTYKAKLSSLYINEISGGNGGSGGGTGTSDHKVAVDASANADYLGNVLVSDCDEIEVKKIDNQLRLGINLTGESDPKIATMPESAVNSATSNYGSYGLNAGYTDLVWGDTTNTSYSWCNAQIYQCMRISEAQGTISKCNVALCGSLSGDRPCLNIGVFDLNGTLLGSTGLMRYSVDFTNGVELHSFDMYEAFVGALKLKRNTRYYLQLWSVGVQLAGRDCGTTYNYTYDHELRQNLATTISMPTFHDPLTDMDTTNIIPLLNFGAANLS